MQRIKNFEQVIKNIWKNICLYVNPENIDFNLINYEDMPEIIFKDFPSDFILGKPLTNSKVLGRTFVSPQKRKVEIYLKQHKTFRLKVLIHELIHARGLRHNEKILFNTEIEQDFFTTKIMQKMGLLCDINLCVNA